MTEILIFIVIILEIIILILPIVFRPKDISKTLNEKNRDLEDRILMSQRSVNDMVSQKIDDFNKSSGEKQELLRKSLISSISQQEERFKTFSMENYQQLEQIRQSLKESISSMQQDNNNQLEKMRAVVDEKLQKSIENKMNESFKLVSERLEQVYKGLGEMNVLAQGVGDLKKVLSNVKTRGILGEIQLGAILKEILAPEQYEENVSVKSNSREAVEFAIKLPGENGDFVYLPIDSKFPGDTYEALVNAYDEGDKGKIDECAKALIRVIKTEAKDISDKYIDPPNTTNFAIMFLPFEGLYAEVVNRGLIEELQRTYKVNIAGPSTMAALLNSLQMGFNTLAIQKRSVEIEKVLQAVKTEFDKFENALMSTQNKLTKASDDLDKLIGTRTRMIKSKLKSVSKLEDDEEAAILLGVDNIEE